MTFKELLEKYNMTNYRLHKETGINETTIGNWVNQKRDPLRMPFEHAKKIADQFEITLDEFYSLLDK